MIRTHLFPVVMVTMIAVVLGSLPAPAEESTVQDPGFRDAVDALRQAKGFPSLRDDTLGSFFIQKKLETLLMDQQADTLDPGRVVEAVGATLHWRHRNFVASGDSRPDLLAALREQPAFLAAVLQPEATHLAFGCAQGARGRLWCVGCVMRQMVELGLFEGGLALLDGGGSLTSFTLSGRTQYPLLRARFYKGDEDPIEYRGPDHHVDAEADDTGAFRVKLPISMFGEGDYRIFLYVKEHSDAKYTIAAHTRFHVGASPSTATGPPTVEPIQGP